MALEQRSSPYGEPAFHALRAAIQQVQQGDPLAPVTVLVHSNAVGVAARRWLAAHGGVAAAQFLTAFRFAELLGGPAMAHAGRRPVSTPVIDVAVRQVLESSSGILAPIARHQATIAALRDAHRELRHLPPAVVQRLGAAGSMRAREVVRVHQAVHAALQHEWYDEADLLRAACTATAAAPPATVVFLPQRVRPTEQALLAALAERGQVVVIEGVSEVPRDLPVDHVDASDADEEVREAVRLVVAAVHDGTPLHRIGIVWPRNEPYARIVGEQLREADIVWNGRPGVAQHERLAARLVLDLLRLDRRGIRRADLFTLLAHVPARTADGEPVPRQRWERIARDAGLGGDGDWGERLSAFARRRRDEHPHDADAAESLQAFVSELRSQLGDADLPMAWSHWSELCHRMMLRWLGGHRGVAALPADEVEAYMGVQAALDRLGRLDAVAVAVTRDVFADTLESELSNAPGRVGRIGVGVHVGPLSFAVGQPFELLVVVGACEGLLPSPPPAEALLGDADRALTDGALPVNAELDAEQQRQLWAALAGAERAVLLSPRGDLRATATRQPTRWLADLTQHSVVTARSVPSFAAGLTHAAFPSTPTQHRVRSLAHAVRAGRPIADHPLVARLAPLRDGTAMLAARALPRFTEYDGDLTGVPIDPLGDRPVSPTRLEQWVACPHGWFMRYVLGVQPVEQPDEQLQITPRDRGNLVHEALDLFHRRVIDGELPQPGPDGWSHQHVEALLEAFDTVGRRMEQQGTTGRRAFWHSEQRRQRHELASWLRRDSDVVAARKATVVASELRFGMHGTPPAVITLPDGTDVRLHGSADRIDRCADGTLVVTDHKTGSATSYRDISVEDPTGGGSKLQLPAYAAAALLHTGLDQRTPVIAEYGFMAKEDFKRISTVVGPHNWPVVMATLQHVLDGIRSGLFLALPTKSQFKLPFTPCEYCDPDHLGTAEAWRRFVLKAGDERAMALLGVEPSPEAADE